MESPPSFCKEKEKTFCLFHDFSGNKNQKA